MPESEMNAGSQAGGLEGRGLSAEATSEPGESGARACAERAGARHPGAQRLEAGRAPSGGEVPIPRRAMWARCSQRDDRPLPSPHHSAGWLLRERPVLLPALPHWQLQTC